MGTVAGGFCVIGNAVSYNTKIPERTGRRHILRPILSGKKFCSVIFTDYRLLLSLPFLRKSGTLI